MNAPAGILLLIGLLQAQDPASSGAARPANINLTGARLSAPTVQLGEVFELTIRARVPGGHVVFFPDTLETRNGVESAGPAGSTLTALPGDSMELVLVYPLRAFAIGDLNLPQADVFLGRAGAAGGDGDGGDQSVRIGSFDDLSLAAPGQYTRRPIVPGSVEVEPVLPLAQPEGGFQPRSPADVLGGNWGIPIFILLGLAGTVLVIALTLVIIWLLRKIRAWPPRTPRTPPVRTVPMTPQQRALAELEAIRAQGLHTSGRMDEFYTLSTAATRRYVEALHPALGPWLTDRELVGLLTSVNGNNGIHSLRNVLRHAEVVRFGMRTPGAEVADGDLEALRRWVAAYPQEPSTS